MDSGNNIAKLFGAHQMKTSYGKTSLGVRVPVRAHTCYVDGQPVSAVMYTCLKVAIRLRVRARVFVFTNSIAITFQLVIKCC